MSFFRLLYWLGPWTNQAHSPDGINRHSHSFRTRSTDHLMWVYQGKKSRHPLFLIPGIQHLGPEDPRLDRFARVLANAGYKVAVPALPTMIGLRMESVLIEDTRNAFLAFASQDQGPISVFSISASSIAALNLASSRETAGNISQLMLFGGYFNWSEALIFAMDGEISPDIRLSIDPLNLPVVLLNVIEDLAVSESARQLLFSAWQRFVCTVWENPEYADRSAFTPVANAVSDDLPEGLRSIFLQGCSVMPGGIEIAREAIGKCSRDTSWLDPEPALKRLKCPLHVAHGRDDVVVPYTHAQKIATTTSCARVYVTGLAHHAGVHGLRRYVKQLPTLFLEVIRSIGLLKAIANLWQFQKH